MATRRRSNRYRKPEVNILFTTTSKTHQRKQLARYGLWAFLMACTLTAVGVGTHFAVEGFLRQAVYQNPRYALKQIVVEVKGGIQRKPVVQATKLVIGQNTMAIDLQQVEKNVEALPYVAQAQVRRQLPDTIVITVTERLPLARITSLRQDLNMKELFYVDADGVAISPQRNEPLRNLPEIVGGRFVDIDPGQRLDQPEVQSALNLLRLLDLTPLRTRFDVAQIDVNRPLAMQMTTRDGAQILFQLDNLPAQLDRLEQVIEYAENRSQQVATIDLTPERNVPVRFKIAANP